MLELTKSAISYSWAMSLFGAQQVANLLTPQARCDPTLKVKTALYRNAQATANQFSDVILGGFQIGDGVQRCLTDLAFDALTLRTFNPGYISRITSDIAEQSKDSLRIFTSPDDARLAWEQLKNSYEVFTLVKNVGSLLDVPTRGNYFDLGKLIENAYRLGQYPDLWAVEGLGHDYTMTFFPQWGSGQPVRGILTDERTSVLPDKSLTMMHAGLGLAFAQQLLKRITPYSPAADIRRLLAQFITLVKDNARAGYEGAAYESLGLVARFQYSQLVNCLDQQLGEFAPDLLSYFWHGAGRAHYFLPLYFVPGLLSPWLAIEREAPHELGRLNMIAGLSWAMTIVNMRQPRIMEVLLKYQGEQVAKTPAFSNGLMSTLIMGTDVTPGDVYVNSFLQHRPDPSDQRVAELWNRLVAGPGNDAVQRIHPVLKKHSRLGEIFRYQNLSALVEQLESGAGTFAASG